MDSLNDDLIAYLYQTLRDTPVEPGVATWFMTEEWLLEVRKLIAPDYRPVWQPGARPGSPMYLFGLPVEICHRPGAPRIVFVNV